MSSNEFKKRVFGLIGIYSKNSKFNADFTGNPRRLPDENGTIYATDKALKYAIRNYWVQQNEKVFVWKRLKKAEGEDKWIPLTLEENYNKAIEQVKENEVERVLSKFLDIKLFGITLALKAKKKENNRNISLTGPCQISYGINKLKENIYFVNDILSPYRDDKENKGEAAQSTKGVESKSLEVLYVYDFSINPKNIVSHYEGNEEFEKLFAITENDINKLKEAMKYAVTKLDTTSKKGSENAFLLWIELPEGSEKILPELKDLLKVEKDKEGKIKVDFREIEDLLSDNSNTVVELYYNDKKIIVKNIDNWNHEKLY